MKIVFLWAFLLFLTSANADAQDQAPAPVVLELFTSQSCSSCPPADKLLGQLEADSDNVIALSCNVTYWNHLHWKDSLSKEFCSTRQGDYVRNLQYRGPYTPQIVINGRDTMVGSKARKIKKSIEKQPPLKNIGLTIEDNNLEINLPETPSNFIYALNLIVFKQSHTQDIPSGENKGRIVHYTNPIEKIISIGTWDGTGKTRNYDISAFKNYKGYIVLAQKNGATGEIIAAGKINQ